MPDTPLPATIASNAEAPAYWFLDILWIVLASTEQTGGRFTVMEQLMPQGAGPGPHVRRSAIVESLLECIEDEAGMGGAARPPTDDPPCERVDHERDVDEARPSRDIGEVRHPEHVRCRRAELTVDVITRARRRAVADRRAHGLPPNDTCQAHHPHEPCDRAARDVKPLAPQLPPHLADAVDAVVGVEHAPHLDAKGEIATRPRRQAQWITALRLVRMIG